MGTTEGASLLFGEICPFESGVLGRGACRIGGEDFAGPFASFGVRLREDIGSKVDRVGVGSEGNVDVDGSTTSIGTRRRLGGATLMTGYSWNTN